MKYLYVAILIASLGLYGCKPKVPELSEKPLFQQDFGIQAYSFRNYFPSDMIGTLDRIQEMGITKIEGDGGRIPPDTFRKLCEERGISIPSTGAGFQELVERPDSVIAKAKALGATFVMCAWVPHERGNFDKAAADNAIEVFNKAGKQLAEAGITLTYHTHGYEFQPYEDGTLLDYIIKKSDPRYLSFEMDIFWIAFGGGDPVALLKKYPDRWKLMHVKDMKKGTVKDLTGQTSIENCVVAGEGELDIPGIIRAGNEVGIVHYFLEDESSAVMEQVPETIAYLKSLKE